LWLLRPESAKGLVITDFFIHCTPTALAAIYPGSISLNKRHVGLHKACIPMMTLAEAQEGRPAQAI
jgi:hypothetical protein